MRILPLIVPALVLVFVQATRLKDPPHGDDFKISCSKCHSAKGWELDPEVYSFDHNSTRMHLEGQHTQIRCRQCHPTLVFSEAETECFLCHTDMHEQTVGNDCNRCHTPHSWIVSDITNIHRQGRFPLLGAHYMAECSSCHPSASSLRFEPLGVECIDCHMADYQAATDPNHVEGNLGTECTDCHSMMAYSWAGEGFTHLFFPLNAGHDIQDCNKCHAAGGFTGTPTDCYACHQQDYLATTNPAHQAAGFSTDCMFCHTTAPGWTPANFDHTSFPLTEGHTGVDCAQCHDVNNFANVSSECFSCHQEDYVATTNPAHQAAGFSTDCMLCHTTAPGWTPASYDHTTFPLTEGHTGVDCAQCHDENDYSNVSMECFSCHQEDYTGAANPNHIAADISTNCLECHTTQPDWKPADFPIHDAQFFPIYSGEHQGEWDNNCTQCHQDLNNYASFTCLSCHEHNQADMDDKHSGETDYQYNSLACLDCHPMGEGDK